MRKKNYALRKLNRIRKNKALRQSLWTKILRLKCKTLAVLIKTTPMIESLSDKAMMQIMANYQNLSKLLQNLRKKTLYLNLAYKHPFTRIKIQLTQLKPHFFATPQAGASILCPAWRSAAKASSGLSVPRISTPILAMAL